MSTRSSKSSAGPRAPIASAVCDDGTIIEMLYRCKEQATAFAIYRSGKIREASTTESLHNGSVSPYSPRNNLLTHKVVLFPSAAASYESNDALLQEVRRFIHRYADLSEAFEEIACYYVLFTWIYDAFNEVPYLRVRGDFGTGKSRFLLTVGSLCYKPIFASGASTTSPIFRILDAFRGTLVMDESDFRLSDEKAEIVKILNNGNATGFPVLRSDATPTKEYNPRAFHVFGPKIIATRGLFADRALESRCITEEMEAKPPRSDIPLNLPSSFGEEAREIRNKLLMFRLRNLHEPRDLESVRDGTIEPRIAQIFAPLLATIPNETGRGRLQSLARRYHESLKVERSMSLEAQLLEAIWDLRETAGAISVKAIAEAFAARYGGDYRRPITARWIGGLLRRRLSLAPVKSNGIFILPPTDDRKLERLFEKYSVGENGGVGDVRCAEAAEARSDVAA